MPRVVFLETPVSRSTSTWTPDSSQTSLRTPSSGVSASSRTRLGSSHLPLSARRIARNRPSSRTTAPATDTECSGVDGLSPVLLPMRASLEGEDWQGRRRKNLSGRAGRRSARSEDAGPPQRDEDLFRGPREPRLTWGFVAHPAGFEPAAVGLEVRHPSTATCHFVPLCPASSESGCRFVPPADVPVQNCGARTEHTDLEEVDGGS
jgi:hypothetical protein